MQLLTIHNPRVQKGAASIPRLENNFAPHLDSGKIKRQRLCVGPYLIRLRGVLDVFSGSEGGGGQGQAVFSGSEEGRGDISKVIFCMYVEDCYTNKFTK